MTRIKGPTDGTTPIDEASAVDPTEAAEGPTETAPTTGVNAPTAARSAGLDALSEVATRLRAGQITVEQALELLIEDAIGRQVGMAVDENGAMEPRLREILREYAANDPFLVAKLRRLNLSK
jgi:hypothetical protein